MSLQIRLYKPQNIKRDKVLCYDVRKRGDIAIEKRLAKARKGTFPTSSSPAERSKWWMILKQGKMKDKYAMIIMASEYEPMLKQLDESKLKTLELESKVTLQDKEIQTLKMRLQAQDEEIKNLRKWDEHVKLLKQQADDEIQTLKIRLQAQEKDIKNLRKWDEHVKLLKQQADDEIKTLKTKLEQIQISKDLVSWSQTSQICEWESERLCSTYAETRRAQLFHFHDQLPDLEENNFNHEFWKKIREWSALGLTLDEASCLIKAKCSPNILRKIEKEIAKKNICDTVPSSPAQKERLLDTMQECVSEALGAGTKLCNLFFSRKMKDGETFEDYIKEMYRLYCAHGCEMGKAPDKNDPMFLQTVVFGLPKEYNNRQPFNCNTYAALLTNGLEIESWIHKAEKRNYCVNCCKNGHIKAQCRRPGGGAEAGPNDCFKCGKRGHWARDCWN